MEKTATIKKERFCFDMTKKFEETKRKYEELFLHINAPKMTLILEFMHYKTCFSLNIVCPGNSCILLKCNPILLFDSEAPIMLNSVSFASGSNSKI